MGLVSIEIFGCTDEKRTEYAIQLGLALQLTNILRDVGEDLTNGRIYLPTAEMEQFGYSLEDLHARRHTAEFVELMRFQAQRASELFANARALLAPQDRGCAVAAEIMRAVYQKLLVKMWWNNFHVFDRRYRLSRPRKLGCIGAELIRSKLHLPPRSGPDIPRPHT